MVPTVSDGRLTTESPAAATGERRRVPGLHLALAGSPVSIFKYSLFSCIGGLINALGLPGSLVGAGLVWWGFARKGRRRLWARAIVVACVVCGTYVLVTNVHNVLWSGHNPLFG